MCTHSLIQWTYCNIYDIQPISAEDNVLITEATQADPDVTQDLSLREEGEGRGLDGAL